MRRAPPARRPLPRAALLLVAVLCTSGCFRAVRAWELRGEALDARLRAESFAVAPAVALERIGRQAPIEHQPCHGDGGCSACTTSFCFALEPQDGGTRVVPDQPLSEESVRLVWQPLNAESLTTASHGLDESVEAQLQEEEARFSPRFGLTFAAFMSFSSGPQLGLGLRAGVRRWHEMHVLSALMAEYESLGTGMNRGALLASLELSRFGAYSEHVLGAPWASVGLVVGATGELSQGVFSPGFRAGVDLHLNQYTGRMPVPLFLELAETTTWPQGAPPHLGARFALGFGL